MGGDGGTLNNTRAEHARIRHSAYGNRRGRAAKASVRSSISECYLSNEPLIPCEVVMDKLGQLYNKSSLIEALLSRNPTVQHVKKLARDVVAVKYVVDTGNNNNMAMCAVTKSTLRCDGTFSVGWFCGCITANITVNGERCDAENARTCAACGMEGYRIVLGQTADRRKRMQKEIIDNRTAVKKKRKRLAQLEANEKKAKLEDGKDDGIEAEGEGGAKKSDVEPDVWREASRNKKGAKTDANGSAEENKCERAGGTGAR